MDFFLFALLLKSAKIPVYSVFNVNQLLAKNSPKQTITFHILQNTGYKNVCGNPPLDQKLVFFRQNIDVEQQTQLKIRKKNKDKEKAFERKNKTENQEDRKES